MHFSILDSFEEEDSKKLKIIMDSVLVPTKNREERKARVNKYLLWVRNIAQLPNSCTEDSSLLYRRPLDLSKRALCLATC